MFRLAVDANIVSTVLLLYFASFDFHFFFFNAPCCTKIFKNKLFVNVLQCSYIILKINCSDFFGRLLTVWARCLENAVRTQQNNEKFVFEYLWCIKKKFCYCLVWFSTNFFSWLHTHWPKSSMQRIFTHKVSLWLMVICHFHVPAMLQALWLLYVFIIKITFYHSFVFIMKITVCYARWFWGAATFCPS